VLGTEATVRQPYVDDLASRFAADCTVIRHGSPELVQLAEAKLAGETLRQQDINAAVQPMLDHPDGGKMDVVVLACTHFPLLRDEILAALPGVRTVDGGPGIARRIAHLTKDQVWPTVPRDGIAVFTGPPPRGALLSSIAYYGLGEIVGL
jgi:glutamate racemase